MVNYLLKISADLENLTDLQPLGGCDDGRFLYFFKMKCENCGTVTEKDTCAFLGDNLAVPYAKNPAHVYQRCKFCRRDGTVTMFPWRGRPLTLEDSEKGAFAPLMLFDCKGYEPLDFSFRGMWRAKSVLSGTVYYRIDLSEGEYADYDEYAQCPIAIYNLRAKFEAMRGYPKITEYSCREDYQYCSHYWT